MGKRITGSRLFSDENINRAEFLCLYMACVFIFLLLVIGAKIRYLTILLRLGMLGSSILFSIASCIDIRRHHRGYPSRLSILMVAWFLLSQLVHFANGNIVHHYTQFLPVYLLAFPFAAITCDSDRQTGLTTLSMVYISVFLIWVLYTVLLLHDCVPQFLQSIIKWDGPRLTIHYHANVCARGFMIGIALSLGFSFKTSRTWAKFLLWSAAVLMFICLSLTNSRSTILITGLLIGGILFFRVYKGGWVQLAAGAVLVLAIILSLFYASQMLFQWNQQQLTSPRPAEQYTASEDQPSLQAITLSAAPMLPQAAPADKDALPGVRMAAASEDHAESQAVTPNTGSAPQHSFAQDIFTLNSRTRIWTNTLKIILENPSILIWGSHTTNVLLEEATAAHTHNVWLEVLLRMGLPGFVICVIFTWRAVISSLALLFRSQADPWKKTISLLVLCMLLSAIFESSLFFTSLSWNYVDFFFFLCLGYMLQWTKQLRTR